MLSGATIEVLNLTKRYGDVEALRGVSFSVNEGEVFGLLGPNGAGKTSTVEILEGLRTPDSGSVSVCGLDPQTSGAEFKYVIGAALQATALPDKMRVHEALDLFGSFYPRRRGTKELLGALASRKSATPSIRSFPEGRSSGWRWPWRW
jgi:ABC-2 type transport system ATP-binding protein